MTGVGPGRDPWDVAQRAVAPPDRGKPSKRVRIVLAERRRTRRVVRTLAEVEEQTGVGEVFVRQLMRNQLALAGRLAGFTVAVLFSIPLAFFLVPSLGGLDVFGLRVAWLLLGVVVYPFLLAVAWSYNRGAERNEQEFSEMVES